MLKDNKRQPPLTICYQPHAGDRRPIQRASVYFLLDPLRTCLRLRFALSNALRSSAISWAFRAVSRSLRLSSFLSCLVSLLGLRWERRVGRGVWARDGAGWVASISQPFLRASTMVAKGTRMCGSRSVVLVMRLPVSYNGLDFTHLKSEGRRKGLGKKQGRVRTDPAV